MTYDVKVLADSISPDGVRLTSMICTYPRFIHSEMLRHRVFSHSVASSRAIPTEKQIERVRTDPFVPETFNKRVKGMGVGDELDPKMQMEARIAWIAAAEDAALHAEALNEIGIDKSRANRLLEPFLLVDDIITSTEWSNFFALRDHPAAQPEFQILARLMRETMETNEPQKLAYGQWHLPLVTSDELAELCADPHLLTMFKMVSAGRCARVSFDRHNDEETRKASYERAEKLITSGHLSPFEHIARPIDDMGEGGKPDYGMWGPESAVFVGNFRGWVQFRKSFPNEDNFAAILAAQEA